MGPTAPEPLSATALANDNARPRLQMADRASIARYQQNRLRTGLRRICDASNRFVQRKLEGFDLRALGDFAGGDSPAFRDLPFTTKQEFVVDQLDNPPVRHEFNRATTRLRTPPPDIRHYRNPA